MSNFAKTAASATLLSLLLAGTALAQGNSGNAGGVGAEASGGVSAGASGNAGGVGAEASGGVSAEASSKSGGPVEAGSRAEASLESNFGRAISAIQTGSDTVDASAAIDTVTVIDVNSELKGNNVAALENALSANETEISDLQASIEANADLMAALATEGVEVSNVIALKTGADGSVTVYTR